MKKITIPTILAATILIAGVFALMPIEQASTIHKTVQSTASHIVVKTITCTVVNDNDCLAFTLDIPSDENYSVVSFAASGTVTADANDDVNFPELTVGGNLTDIDIAEIDGANNDHIQPGNFYPEKGVNGNDITSTSANGGTQEADDAIKVDVTLLVPSDVTAASITIGLT